MREEDDRVLLCKRGQILKRIDGFEQAQITYRLVRFEPTQLDQCAHRDEMAGRFEARDRA